MPLCISCGEPIPEGKRKHAVYCDSKCRGKQYRKRHPKPVATDGSCQQRTSTVLECTCGRRYLLSVMEQHAHDDEAVTTEPPASVTQTDSNTDSNTEEKWIDRRHEDAQSVAQTVLHAVSPNATQDRQSQHLPQDDTQTASARDASTSDDGNNRDFDRIMWEHIEKLLPKVLSDLASRNNVTPGNKASVTQTDSNTDSNTEEKWTDRRHADGQSVAQTVLQAVSPNATQDRQSEQLPPDDTQTVSATTANTSDDGNNRDPDRIMWEHIEKLLPKVLSDLVSRNNVTLGNKTKHQR